MTNLPAYNHYNGEKRIALLDNSSIAFMHQLKRLGHSPEQLFSDYDVLLIPSWVLEEIQDSEYRIQYVDTLVESGFHIYSISEEQYSDLVEQEDVTLYKIVKAAVSSLGVLMRYLRQNVETDDLLDLPPYEEWIHSLYDDWPLKGNITASGREKKKNAGEISLTILAEIFSFYYPEMQALTIYTQDTDCYHFQQRAEEELKKNFSSTCPITVTYKSNDFILCQLYRNQQLSIEEITQLRKDSRTVTYTQERPDKSVAFVKKCLDNKMFTQLIQDASVQIIF